MKLLTLVTLGLLGCVALLSASTARATEADLELEGEEESLADVEAESDAMVDDESESEGAHETEAEDQSAFETEVESALETEVEVAMLAQLEAAAEVNAQLSDMVDATAGAVEVAVDPALVEADAAEYEVAEPTRLLGSFPNSIQARYVPLIALQHRTLNAMLAQYASSESSLSLPQSMRLAAMGSAAEFENVKGSDFLTKRELMEFVTSLEPTTRAHFHAMKVEFAARMATQIARGLPVDQWSAADAGGLHRFTVIEAEWPSLSDAWNGIKSGAKAAGNFAMDVAKDTADTMVNGAKAVADLPGAAKEAWNTGDFSRLGKDALAIGDAATSLPISPAGLGKAALKTLAKDALKAGAKKLAKEGAKDLAKTAAKDMAKNAAKDTAKAAAKDAAKAAGKDAAKAAGKDAAKGAEKGMMGKLKDKAMQKAKDKLKDEAKDKLKEKAHDALEKIANGDDKKDDKGDEPPQPPGGDRGDRDGGDRGDREGGDRGGGDRGDRGDREGGDRGDRGGGGGGGGDRDGGDREGGDRGRGRGRGRGDRGDRGRRGDRGGR